MIAPVLSVPLRVSLFMTVFPRLLTPQHQPAWPPRSGTMGLNVKMMQPPAGQTRSSWSSAQPLARWSLRAMLSVRKQGVGFPGRGTTQNWVNGKEFSTYLRCGSSMDHGGGVALFALSQVPCEKA